MKNIFTILIKNCKNFLATTFILFFLGPALAQNTFEKLYGTDLYDVTNSIEKTADLGYILSGTTGHFFDTCTSQIAVVKCDAEGNIQWSNSYSTPFCDQGYTIKQTADHGYILTGLVIDMSVQTKMVLMKLDSIGQIEWQNFYYSDSHDEGVDLYQVSNGYLISGYWYNFVSLGYDLTLTRLDESGNILWSTVYLTADAEYGYTQLFDNGDHTYFISCTQLVMNSFPFNENFYLLHVDSSGNVLSSRSYGNDDEDDKGWGMAKINSNRYWLIGSGGANLDALLIQIDSTGNVVWAKRYNDGTYSIDESSVTSFSYLAETGLFICGFDAFYNPYSFIIDLGNAFVFQVDDDGSVVWWKDYGTQEQYYWEEFVRMRIANDGGLLLAGSRTTDGNYDEQNGWDMYIVKTDVHGDDGCEVTMNVNVTDIDVAMQEYPVTDSDMVLTVIPAGFIAAPFGASSTLCYPTSINDLVKGNDVNVYPDPADDILHVTNNTSQIAKEIQFYDLFGRVVSEKKIDQAISISDLHAGFYLYKVLSEKGDIIKKGKLLIQH